MRRKHSLFVALVVLLGLVGTAAAARIVSVATCRDIREPGTIPVGAAEEFTTDIAKIHAVIVLADVAAGTVVRGSWISVDAIETPNYEIDAAEVSAPAGEARVHFALSRPTAGWPQGNYRLDVFLDGTFVTNAPFSIAAASAPVPAAPPAPAPSATSGNLTGCWRCESAEGQSSLEFQAGNVLIFDGLPSHYRLVPGAIRIEDEFGAEDYRYTLGGNNLQVTFPDGFQLRCSRVECGASGYGEAPAPAAPGYPAAPAPGGGNTHLLQGWFCSYASSGMAVGSGYSRSNRVYFDGQGNFSTRSESAYSGDPGIAYGQGGGDGGTYRVEGDRVMLTFGDGSGGAAQIYNRRGDGSISELMYNGELYAPQLCE